MKGVKLTKGEDYVIFSKQKMAAEYLGCKTSSFSTYKNSGKCKGFTVEEIDDDKVRTINNNYSVDKKGRIEDNNANVEVFLRQNCKSFRFNEFLRANEVNGKETTDEFYKGMNSEMDKQIGVHDMKRLEEEVTVLCRADSYHPLIEKIESIKWDGVKRAETFFIDYVGAEDTPLNRKYTISWFKAAIKRLYEPGCAYDHMIILFDHKQGTGKTKLFKRLSYDNVSINPDISNKDIVATMNESWIINFDELSQFDKKDMNNIKTFISGDRDVVRLAYRKDSAPYLRHVVCCGTTNEDHFLRDYTSRVERRFFIMECDGKYVKKDAAFWNKLLPDTTIDQVWAEVLEKYREDDSLEISYSDEDTIAEERIHIKHKSFGNDPSSLVKVESILESRYTKCALSDVKAFLNEVKFNNSYTDGELIDKIRFDWVASQFRNAPDYVKAVIIHHGGWHFENDGKYEYIVRDHSTSINNTVKISDFDVE